MEHIIRGAIKEALENSIDRYPKKNPSGWLPPTKFKTGAKALDI